MKTRSLLPMFFGALLGGLQPVLAQLRRVEQHQATTINWLIGADHSPLETTIAYEQVAIDVTFWADYGEQLEQRFNAWAAR